MIRVSLQHQTAVFVAACVFYERVTKTTFAAVDYFGNTSMTTQTIHSNLNGEQTGQGARMKPNQWWDEKRDHSTLVDGASNAQNERGAGERWWPGTLLLPKSIGDSQPRDRRLPASSLHSATTGKKRKAELIDKTCGGGRSMETGMRQLTSFHAKEATQNRTDCI